MLSFAENGYYLAVAITAKLVLIDLREGDVVSNYDLLEKDIPQNIIFSPSGEQLLFLIDSLMYSWEIETKAKQMSTKNEKISFFR